MLFNSFTFAAFLPAVLLLFFVSPHRSRRVLLVLASYVFYCWETPAYGLLLLASTTLDYTVGRLMERTQGLKWRRSLLFCSLAGNLGMLGFFKYADFFGESIFGLGRLLGFDGTWEAYGFVLPVGISFYTFQTISYSIQVYRKQVQAEHEFITFALYVSFFPQLVAGPIERASHLLPQLKGWNPVTADDLRYGVERIITGLFMKLVIADRLAILVDLVFADPGHYPMLTVWIAALCFSGQIYMDFAGYASIAIGTARLFGVRIVENFNCPMAARSVGDFWARWHMTLTSWFRDYVFTPLGGFRKGGARAAMNGAIVLMLCGLWHGAEWHFVMWGTYHAGLMICYYMIRTARRRLRGGKSQAATTGFRVLPWVVFTLWLNTISGVFFRAPSMSNAWEMLKVMFGVSTRAPAPVEWYAWLFLAFVGGLFAVDFTRAHLKVGAWWGRAPWYVRSMGYALLAGLTVLGAVSAESPYIYFQF